MCVVDGVEGEAKKGKGTACWPMGPAGGPGGIVFCTPYSFMFLYSVENTGYNDVGSAVSLLSFPCSYSTELRDERGIRAESAGAHRSHRRRFLTECFGAFSVEVEVRADPRTHRPGGRQHRGREGMANGAGRNKPAAKTGCRVWSGDKTGDNPARPSRWPAMEGSGHHEVL